MTADTLRAAFVAVYGVSLAVMALKVLPAAIRNPTPARRAEGARRWLPVVLVPFGFLVPPTAMLARWGELDVAAPAMRTVGVVVALYGVGLMLAAAATLGRFLVPQAVTQRDHALVTGGPYRFVRHPAYGGDLALWLGAALATANVLLLALWPLYAVGVRAQVGVEEALLDAHFGASYRTWAARTGRLMPRLRGAAPA
jgi:protein-S-isoprenylcysteine O-methyltransferase Ste14